MKIQKKHIAAASAAALLLLTPLVVFALMLRSETRVNRFRPAEEEIRISENSKTPTEMQEQSYEWPAEAEPANTVYSIEKTVSVEEISNPNGEYLRVRFVPAWYDDSGNIWSNVSGITDMRSMTLNSAETALEIKNGSGDTIVTLILDDAWKDHWEYRGDGCFESKEPVYAADEQQPLLKTVEISNTVYDAAKTANIRLRIDVLADSVQTAENGASVVNPRWSVSP